MFGTQNNFAERLEMAPNTLSSKLANITDFTASEISKSVELLDIQNPKEAWELFFTKEVEKSSTKQK